MNGFQKFGVSALAAFAAAALALGTGLAFGRSARHGPPPPRSSPSTSPDSNPVCRRPMSAPSPSNGR